MKIGIFDPYLDTMTGGEKYMLTIAACLSEKHTVSLFWNKTEEDKIRQKAAERFAIDLQAISFDENIFGKNTSLLSRLRKSAQYDYIILLSDGSIPLLACKFALHFQTPIEWVHVSSLKTRIKMRNITHVICNSYFTKHYIDKKLHIASTVIYPPVYSQKKDLQKENVILNVGRFGIYQAGSSFKKQEILADAFKKLYSQGIKNWKLVFVVSYMVQDERKSLEDLKQQYRDLPIVFIENPPNDELWEWYSKAKIYWHAAGFHEDLILHPDRAEHFGIATVEAMSTGAVPIVISAGGQKEIIEDGKNGFLWSTLEELLNKTEQVMSSDTLWTTISKASITKSIVFSKERFCQEIGNIIP